MSGILMMAVGNSYGSAPVNTVAPAVTGTAAFGSTLTTTNGTWTGAPAPTFTYQWFRSPSTSISGATSSTYVLVAADVGFGIFCQVTATNSVAPSGVTANSNTTASVVAIAPGAPTIGTATATSSTTATVAYTAPASNGGATITLYTATSSPGGVTGTLATAGSGTITVSGLSPSTSYTFTVTATNSAGTSAASAASNSVTTAAAVGQIEYTTTGTVAINTNFVAPAGVTSISILCVGPGSGAGGGLAYYNNYSVTPGGSYAIYVGVAQYSTAYVSFVNTSTCSSGPYQNYQSGQVTQPGGLNTGGGAAGYSGRGGNCNVSNRAGQAGLGGGGGSAGNYDDGTDANIGGGGGVGILGEGASGAGGVSFTRTNAAGGGGGSGGGTGVTTSYNQNLNAGPYPAAYGGGTAVNFDASRGYVEFQNGGVTSGIVRIIWPGTTRSFPSTNTGNL
jgi:hypothetical protein